MEGSEEKLEFPLIFIGVDNVINAYIFNHNNEIFDECKIPNSKKIHVRIR